MSEPGAEAVFVIDELKLRAGALDAFLSAFHEDYRPGAESRGQRLLHVWVTPPTAEASLRHEVVIVWSVDGIPGFWGMRSQNATPDVLRWWATCDERWVESRTRRFAAPPDALPALDAAGRANA